MGPDAAPVVSAASSPNGDLANAPARKRVGHEGAEHLVARPAEGGLGSGVPLEHHAAAVDLDEGVRAPARRRSSRWASSDRARARRAVRSGLAVHAPPTPPASPCRASCRPSTCRAVRRPPRQPSEFVDHGCALQPASAAGPRGRGGYRVNLGTGRLPVQGFAHGGAVGDATPAPPLVDRSHPDAAVYRACRGRGHRYRAEAGMGGQGPATGGAGAARTVVDPGAHPGQPAALRPRLRPRARRGGRRHRRRRVGHRRGVGRPHRRSGHGRRQHLRRRGGPGDPHPPGPLRPGRTGA